MTTVVNINSLSKQQRHLLMQGNLKGYVYIGRGLRVIPNQSEWGNRWTHKASSMPGVHKVESRAKSVECHERYVNLDEELREKIKRELVDKVLVCWCWPLPCHGDVLARIANGAG